MCHLKAQTFLLQAKEMPVRRLRINTVCNFQTMKSAVESNRLIEIPNIVTWIFRKFLAKTIRSSHWRCSVKWSVLKSFTNFTGRLLCWSLFSNLEADSCIFIRRLQHSCFPLKFVKSVRTPILKVICEQLLLNNATFNFQGIT